MNLQDCTYNELSSRNTLTSSIYKYGYFLRTYRYVQPICLNVQYLPCSSCTKEKIYTCIRKGSLAMTLLGGE